MEKEQRDKIIYELNKAILELERSIGVLRRAIRSIDSDFCIPFDAPLTFSGRRLTAAELISSFDVLNKAKSNPVAGAENLTANPQ